MPKHFAKSKRRINNKKIQCDYPFTLCNWKYEANTLVLGVWLRERGASYQNGILVV